MTDTVGKGVPADARGFGDQQVLVLTRIDPQREYFTVGLVFMDGAQVLAQHPYSRVEPLEGGEGIHEEQVPRVTQADVSPFMSENRWVGSFVVAAVHHDIVHPAEGRQVCVTGHADTSAVLLRMLLAVSDELENLE